MIFPCLMSRSRYFETSSGLAVLRVRRDEREIFSYNGKVAHLEFILPGHKGAVNRFILK